MNILLLNLFLSCLIFLNIDIATANDLDSQSYIVSIEEIDENNLNVIVEIREVLRGEKYFKGGKIAISRSYILHQDEKISPFLFVKLLKDVPDPAVIFYVYGVGSDQYKSMKKNFKKMNIKYYLDDLPPQGMVWVPASCNDDVSMCQYEIDIIAENRDKSGSD